MNNNNDNFLTYKFYDLPTKPSFVVVNIVPTTLIHVFPSVINNIPFVVIPNN